VDKGNIDHMAIDVHRPLIEKGQDAPVCARKAWARRVTALATPVSRARLGGPTA
jgi:hypothetical protein